jgi:hypothetical protein
MNCPIVVAEDSTWILHKTIGYMFFGLCKDKTINAGTYIGYVKYLRNMITDICSIFDCKNIKLDDQQILTAYCKKNNICIVFCLVTNSEYYQNLYDSVLCSIQQELYIERKIQDYDIRTEYIKTITFLSMFYLYIMNDSHLSEKYNFLMVRIIMSLIFSIVSYF